MSEVTNAVPPIAADFWLALGIVLVTLLLLALTTLAGQAFITRLLAAWVKISIYRAKIVSYVDEPTDPIIQRIDSLEPVLTAEEWSKALKPLLEGIFNGLDIALGPRPPADDPPQEAIK